MSNKENQPYIITVQIPESLDPLTRCERYEEPFEEYFEENPGLAEVEGGGTLLNPNGGISIIDISFILIDKDRALPIIIQKFEELGVPKGTKLVKPSGETITFGVNEGISIAFPREDLEKAKEECCNINYIISHVNEALAGKGNITSWNETKQDTILYAFGASANQMKLIVIEFLNTNPLGKCATVATVTPE